MVRIRVPVRTVAQQTRADITPFLAMTSSAEGTTSMRCNLTPMILIMVLCIAGVCRPAPPLTNLSGQSVEPVTRVEDSLKRFIQNYAGRPSTDRPTRYLNAWIDLNGDGKREAIVYLIGSDWCGSGGCTALVLEPARSTYEVIAHVSIVQLPISALTRSSRGWRDLTVWVYGGGIQNAYEAELKFDGRSYPSNPSVPPAVHLVGKPEKEALISNIRDAKPLFP